MEDIDIPPILNEYLPSRMRNCGHEERIEEEYDINEGLDVRKIFREPEPVDVDL